MAKYTSRDGTFTSDDPVAVNNYNNGAGAKTPTAPSTPGTDAPGGLGVAQGGQPLPTLNGDTAGAGNPFRVGGNGQIFDISQQFGEGSTTPTGMFAPTVADAQDRTRPIGGSPDLDLTTHDPGNRGPTVTTPQDSGNTSQPNGVGSPNTAPGTLVPGGANVSNLKDRDARDFEYGRTPGYGRDVIGQARTQAAAFGAENRDLGQQAADIGATYGTQVASAGQRGTEIGAGVQSDLRGQADLARARGADLGGGLTGLEATEGPSAAQAQLANSTSQGMNDALTLARSGRGLGGSAAAVSQAGARLPGAQAAGANAAAALRAQENAQWRSRQAGNMTNAAGIEQRGLDQGQAATVAGGQTALAGNAQGMQGSQAGGEMTLAGKNAQTAATQAGQGQFWQGESLADTISGRQTQQDLAYENMLTQEKGINAGIAINAANNEQSIWPAVIGAGATGLAMAASDERNKDFLSEDPVKLSSAIHGNPYGRTGAPGGPAKSGPADRSDLTPYGHAGAGAFDSAQRQSTEALQKGERESQMRLRSAIKGFGDIAADYMTPKHRSTAEGQAMINQGLSFQPGQAVMSDERSKNKIADLEGQLAEFRSATSGPPATQGAQRGDVDTSALDLARARGGAPDFTQSPAYAYTYKDPSIPGAAPGVQVGPMAQDLEKAGSRSVLDTPTGKMVDPSRLTMENSSAIGEVQSRQDDLDRQFAELEAMLRKPEKSSKQQSAGAY